MSKILINVNDEINRYEIYGNVNGKIVHHYVPINGHDFTLVYNNNFNKKVINRRRKEILFELEQMNNKYTYDKDNIFFVDTTLYKLLKQFDEFYKTKYSEDYLRVVMSSIPRSENETDAMYKRNCLLKRRKELLKMGININYYYSLFNGGNRDIKFMDRIRGIFIAKAQAKRIGAKAKIELFNSNINEIDESIDKYIKDEKEKDEMKSFMKKIDDAIDGKKSEETTPEIERIVDDIVAKVKDDSNEVEEKSDINKDKNTEDKTELKPLDSRKQNQSDKEITSKKNKRRKRIQQAKKNERESKKWKNVYANNKGLIEEKRKQNKQYQKDKDDINTNANEDSLIKEQSEFIQEPVKFTRKIEDKEDSIRNKKYKIGNKSKKRIIAGICTFIAGVGLLTTITLGKSEKQNNDDTKVRTENAHYENNNEDISYNKTGIEYDYSNNEVAIRTTEEDNEQKKMQNYLENVTLENLNVSGIKIYKSVYDFGDENKVATTIQSDSRTAQNSIILLRLKDSARGGKEKRYIYSNELKNLSLEELRTIYQNYDALIGRQGVDFNSLTGQELIDAINENSIGWATINDIVTAKLEKNSDVQIVDTER